MSLDVRARDAVRELRDASRREPALPMLRDLDERQSSRQRTRRNALVSVVVVLVAVAGYALGLDHGGRDAAVRPGSVAPSEAPHCGSSRLICLGGGAYRVLLPAPVTFTLPTDFQDSGPNEAARTVEVYNATMANNTGVTVFENAVAVTGDTTPDPTAGSTPRSVANWLAARPFVMPATVRATTVAGLPAYRVDVRLRPGSPLPVRKAIDAAALTFVSDESWSAAVSEHLAISRYYVLDVPGSGLTVIWSWTYDGAAGDLEPSEAVIASLRFG